MKLGEKNKEFNKMSENKIIINGIDVSKWTDEESRYKTVLSFNVYSKLAKYVKEHKLEEL